MYLVKFGKARCVANALLGVISQQDFYHLGVGGYWSADTQVQRSQTFPADAVDWSTEIHQSLTQHPAIQSEASVPYTVPKLYPSSDSFYSIPTLHFSPFSPFPEAVTKNLLRSCFLIRCLPSIFSPLFPTPQSGPSNLAKRFWGTLLAPQ